MIKVIICFGSIGTANVNIKEFEEQHSNALEKLGYKCLDGNFTIHLDIRNFEKKAAFTILVVDAIISLSTEGEIPVVSYKQKEELGGKVELNFDKGPFFETLRDTLYENPYEAWRSSFKLFVDKLSEELSKNDCVILDFRCFKDPESSTRILWTAIKSIIDIWETENKRK